MLSYVRLTKTRRKKGRRKSLANFFYEDLVDLLFEKNELQVFIIFSLINFIRVHYDNFSKVC